MAIKYAEKISESIKLLTSLYASSMTKRKVTKSSVPNGCAVGGGGFGGLGRDGLRLEAGAGQEMAGGGRAEAGSQNYEGARLEWLAVS